MPSLKRVLLAATAAAGASMLLSVPAQADNNDPCNFKVTFLCRFMPIAPDLDHDVDLTDGTESSDWATSRGPADAAPNAPAGPAAPNGGPASGPAVAAPNGGPASGSGPAADGPVVSAPSGPAGAGDVPGSTPHHGGQ
jgi:hypothetical protein